MGANNLHEFSDTNTQDGIADNEPMQDYGAAHILEHGLALQEDGKTPEQKVMGLRLVNIAGRIAVKEAELDGVEIDWGGKILDLNPEN